MVFGTNCPWIRSCLHRLMHKPERLVRNGWRAISERHPPAIEINAGARIDGNNLFQGNLERLSKVLQA